MEENAIVLYRPAAEIIKTAILQGQYEAAKGVNRIQLAVYFGIGKFVSQNTRKGVWGSGALESISQILRKELPGLKGHSASSMKNMRKFYENWQMLDPNSSVTTDDNNSASVLVEMESNKSTSAIVELQNENHGDRHLICTLSLGHPNHQGPVSVSTRGEWWEYKA